MKKANKSTVLFLVKNNMGDLGTGSPTAQRSTGSLRYVIIATLMIGLVGCRGADKNLQADKSFERLFQQHPVGLSDKKNLTPPDDVETPGALPEMTGPDHERLGDVYFSQGNLQMAFVHYEKSLRLIPDTTRIYYKEGLLFLSDGVCESAFTEFQEVLKREPEHALAREGLGQVHFRLKNYGEAEKQFLEAVRINPNLWKSHDFLGILYDYKKQHEKAIREYEAAIALNPTNGLLRNNLGVSYFLTGEYEKAIESFNKALQGKSPQSRTYNNLGLALARLERYDEALEAFRKGGGEAESYNNLGCVFLSEGEPDKAKHYFEKAIALKPAFYTMANENLKRCEMGNLSEKPQTSNDGSRIQ